MEPIRAGVVTVSDKGYAGEREDVSGPLLADLLRGTTVRTKRARSNSSWSHWPTRRRSIWW